MHADLRHERVLKTLLTDRGGSLDLNSTSQQARLSVDLVTCQRTVAATNAEVHVHDQHISAVDDSGRDLLFGCFECVQVRQCFDGQR